jgi:hypothetical protein
VDPRLVGGPGQLVERTGQGADGKHEVEDLANEEVDPARGLVARVAEDVALDLSDILDQLLDDVVVVGGDAVADGMEDGAGSEPGQARSGVDVRADPGQRTGLTMPHRQHESRAHEDAELSALHLVAGLQVARRPEHEEERLAVELELWPLVDAQRVFDREWMELERPLGHRHLLLGRHPEAEPHECAVGSLEVAEIGERQTSLLALADRTYNAPSTITTVVPFGRRDPYRTVRRRYGGRLTVRRTASRQEVSDR